MSRVKKAQQWVSTGGEMYAVVTGTYLNGGFDWATRVSEPGDVLTTEPSYNGLGELVSHPSLPELVRKAGK